MTVVHCLIAFALIAIGWRLIDAVFATQKDATRADMADRAVEDLGRHERAELAFLPASLVTLNRIHEASWERGPTRSMINPPRRTGEPR
ncbi:MAG: hypothetical protein M3O28_00335 [Actinomycetota bacterium]|nr:hypothetical protein [Actinomycetota bacterium]